ncbi:ESX secretion-associated protein EspG [Nocardia sp. NPDC052566]|uniref:ESX secretion-associated protein EspG n=1 Tax=Nocardia sp. NPDC052566 TaxID=3364330 RepID=UPI0037C978AF
MNRAWRTTDLKFAVLWEMLYRAPLPPPLLFTSRTPLLDDYEREKTAVAAELRGRIDGSLRAALDAVAAPLIRIEVHGRNEDSEPAHRVRVLAGHNAIRGCVVTQLPGETESHSGGYLIAECDPEQLAGAVLAALGHAPPGCRGTVPLLALSGADGMDYSFGRSLTGDDGATAWAADFLRMPTERHGVIDISQGRSKFGPRGIGTHVIAWRDLVDDGRYAIVCAGAPTAVGVGAAQLTALVDAGIETMLARLADEDR